MKKPENLKDLRGIRNNNPGNIRHSTGMKWQGLRATQTDENFLQFQSPEYGVRAIAKTLITYYEKRTARDGSKIDTIKEVIDRWAPPTENNTVSYAKYVSDILNIGVNDTIDIYDYGTMKALVIGIVGQENYGYKYPEAVIDKGIALAGIEPPKKSLKKSRTLAGGSIIAAGAVVQEAKTELAPYAADFQTIHYVCLGLTVLGLLTILYAYLSDRKKRIT
jgi:hypothetical protein